MPDEANSRNAIDEKRPVGWFSDGERFRKRGPRGVPAGGQEEIALTSTSRLRRRGRGAAAGWRP